MSDAITTLGRGKQDRAQAYAAMLSRTAENPVTGCHIYFGVKSSNGYGSIKADGRTVSTHRLSYEMARGGVPEGLVIDHLCWNRACVNPDHMEAVTQKVNLRRGFSAQSDNAKKTHCVRGHPFSGDNLHIDKRGSRICRECKRQTQRKTRARRARG